MQNSIYPGKLIAIEGPDGIGKTTTIHDVEKQLQKLPKDNPIHQAFNGIIVTKEPGATKLGQKLRDLILDSNLDIDRRTQLFLFLADRIQHLHDVIVKGLKENKLVICDRYLLSTLVYQFNFTNLDLTAKDPQLTVDLDQRLLNFTKLVEIGNTLDNGFKVLPDLQVVFTATPKLVTNRLKERNNNDNNDNKLANPLILQQLLNRYHYVIEFAKIHQLQRHYLQIDANLNRTIRANQILTAIANYLI